MPITPSLRHCSNKYTLAREGEKDKEKDEDFEKVKEFFFFFFFAGSAGSVNHTRKVDSSLYSTPGLSKPAPVGPVSSGIKIKKV